MDRTAPTPPANALAPDLPEDIAREAIAFRRAMLHVRDDLGRDDWWFSVWQPTKLERSLDKGDTPAPLVAKREEW
ncbi:hypothetical protein G6F55_014561 [Rhizopus delemar]|nr:hypothetical protein G6F55_014561 [Rhizopus delemar]